MKMSSKEKTIEKFLEFCKSENLTQRRINKHRYLLKNISEWLKTEFKKASKEDIQKLVTRINESKYADWTKSDHKKCLKKFYKWLEGDGEEFPKKVRWIKIGKVTVDRRAEEMLTQEEIKKMIESALNIRDRAFIAVLYESGCRIGELLTLKIKSVQFNGNVVHLHVTGKTGERPVPIVTSVPYLSTWINNHPKKYNLDNPLFVSIGTRNQYKQMTHSASTKLLRDIGNSAGIKKKINPHNFRHSRASHLANKLKEPQMRQYFGWSKNSRMPDTYVHLSGRDIDDAIREINGLKKSEPGESEKTLAPRICSRCEKINESTASYCLKCGLPLTTEELLRNDSGKDKIFSMIEQIIEEKLQQKIKQHELT